MSPSGPIAVVGPSGVGKDTLMQAACRKDPSLHLVRRVITRGREAGGEDFEGVSPEEFEARKAAGHFAMDWTAHGLCYGIPASIHADLETGCTVLFNGSRAMLGEAARVFPGLRVIHVTARDDVLRARLVARGRETAEDIDARLERAKLSLPVGLNVTVVDNSGALERSLDLFLAALQPVRA